MAKRHNQKLEKAKRNAEYALKFKKRKRAPSRRPTTFSSAAPATAEGAAPSTSRAPGHEAVCSACGAETTLPFKPVSGKPVFCRPCFEKKSA